MKITIAQLNPTVGDIEGNLQKVLDTFADFAELGTDLIVFPELFLTGYPPQDMLERSWVIKNVQNAITKIQKASLNFPGTGLLLGAPVPSDHKSGTGLHNSALLILNGKTIFNQPKTLLPTYDVFDEARHFDPANTSKIISFKGEKLGISICEDAWNLPSTTTKKRYANDPISVLAKKGATILINISASPFNLGKEEKRFKYIHAHAKKYKLPFIYVNQVGGNDELIFDGRSICLNDKGAAIFIGDPFKEHLETIDLAKPGKTLEYVPEEKMKTLHDALILGVQDYLRKCGFFKAVIGLSGGIDSALVCSLAVQALGKKHVLGISMPSPFSSKGSIEDSRQLAKNLGIEFKVLPITPIYETYLASLKEHFQGKPSDIAEENIQARIRGNILMAFSNKFGYLTLSTGNKSEQAVGYCTLYGDMSGGLSVISDVPKTMVYELAKHINKSKEIIPQAVIDKVPSAELRPDQKDQDTLPPYNVLDEILNLYIEEGYSLDELIKKKKFDKKTVEWIIKAVDHNEYKRKQAAPGLKVTSKAFGVGRRMPIAARFPY
ncbi:NAD+ synthase [Candidatus Margulisiibacteriota bacterium]